MTTPDLLRAQLVDLTARIAAHQAGRPLDGSTAAWLNREFGPQSAAYAQLKAVCEAGVAAGWLCNREHAGIRYGRIFKPADDLHRFSVDVVDMRDIAGGHHVHPTGEIDLVMPLEGAALFDGHGAGWCVYGPGTAHWPTVAGGRALVMYLLPEGRIDFTGQPLPRAAL